MLTISWFLVAAVVAGIASWAAVWRLKLLVAIVVLSAFWWFTPTTRDYLPIPMLSPMELILYLFLFYALVFEEASVDRFLNTPNVLLKPVAGGLIALFALGLAGLVFESEDLPYGSYYLRNTSLLPLGIMLVAGVSVKTRSDVERILGVLLVGTTVFCIILLVNYFGRTFDPESLINTNFGARLGGQPMFPFRFRVVYDPVSLGVALSILFPFVASWSIGSLKSAKGWLGLTALVLILAVVFATGTRGAWIALIGSSLVVFFLSRNSKAKVWIVVLFASIIALFVALDLIAANPILEDRVASLQDVGREGNLAYRLELIEKAWDILKSNPLGIGYGRFDRPIMNEHNMYMFFALGSGLTGLIVFGFVILVLLRNLWAGYSHLDGNTKAIAAGGIGSLVSLLINGFGDATLMEAYQTQAFFLVMGISHTSISIAAYEQAWRTNETQHLKERE